MIIKPKQSLCCVSCANQVLTCFHNTSKQSKEWSTEYGTSKSVGRYCLCSSTRLMYWLPAFHIHIALGLRDRLLWLFLRISIPGVVILGCNTRFWRNLNHAAKKGNYPQLRKYRGLQIRSQWHCKPAVSWKLFILALKLRLDTGCTHGQLQLSDKQYLPKLCNWSLLITRWQPKCQGEYIAMQIILCHLLIA